MSLVSTGLYIDVGLELKCVIETKSNVVQAIIFALRVVRTVVHK